MLNSPEGAHILFLSIFDILVSTFAFWCWRYFPEPTAAKVALATPHAGILFRPAHCRPSEPYRTRCFLYFVRRAWAVRQVGQQPLRRFGFCCRVFYTLRGQDVRLSKCRCTGPEKLPHLVDDIPEFRAIAPEVILDLPEICN